MLSGFFIFSAMILENRLIAFDAIDSSDKWNLHPWALYNIADELAASFSRVGVLHPPILLCKKDNRYEILCGFKRLLFASSVLQCRFMSCLIIPEGADAEVILDIILTDQALFNPLSLAEKARFLHLCEEKFSRQKVTDLYFDRLMLEKRASTFTMLAKLLAGNPALLSEIDRGALQERIVRELLDLPSAPDRVAVVKLFKELRLGEGKQRMILPLVRELACRLGLSISSLLEDQSIREILCRPGMNNPQKTQHLAAFLKGRINPLSTKAEIAFVHDVSTLKLPKNYLVTHSPSFEKDEVTLSITFKDLMACKQWITGQRPQ
jgi:ParB-like chromosome segregation protein Spo0J